MKFAVYAPIPRAEDDGKLTSVFFVSLWLLNFYHRDTETQSKTYLF